MASLPRTATGIRLGSAEAEVRITYGATSTTLLGWPGACMKGFELDGLDGQVIKFKFGDETGTVDQMFFIATFPASATAVLATNPITVADLLRVVWAAGKVVVDGSMLPRPDLKVRSAEFEQDLNLGSAQVFRAYPRAPIGSVGS